MLATFIIATGIICPIVVAFFHACAGRDQYAADHDADPLGEDWLAMDWSDARRTAGVKQPHEKGS